MRSPRLGVAAGIETVVGRRNLLRYSRFLQDYARRDLPNQLEVNGERLLQAAILAGSTSRPVTVFDVGANVGAWTLGLVAAARATGVGISVHAFEPSKATFAQLERALAGIDGESVTAVPMGASDHAGDGKLFTAHELAGSNSLHGVDVSSPGHGAETVQLCSIDGYCHARRVDSIDFLKVDAEGHDAYVLDGARTMLGEAAIGVVQFEYNRRWIDARRYLKDVFDALTPMGFRIGKVTPKGVEWFPRWDAEMETFREANYVAARSPWVERLPFRESWYSAP